MPKTYSPRTYQKRREEVKLYMNAIDFSQCDLLALKSLTVWATEADMAAFCLWLWAQDDGIDRYLRRYGLDLLDESKWKLSRLSLMKCFIASMATWYIDEILKEDLHQYITGSYAGYKRRLVTSSNVLDQ